LEVTEVWKTQKIIGVCKYSKITGVWKLSKIIVGSKTIGSNRSS